MSGPAWGGAQPRSDHAGENLEVAPELSEHEKLVPHAALGVQRHPCAAGRIGEQAIQRIGHVRWVGRAFDHQSVLAGLDLLTQSAGAAHQRRRSLPHGLGGGQAEAFLDRILDHDGRTLLKRRDDLKLIITSATI